MAEDQVVVGDEVEEPDVQLLRIMALKVNNAFFRQISESSCYRWLQEVTSLSVAREKKKKQTTNVAS